MTTVTATDLARRTNQVLASRPGERRLSFRMNHSSQSINESKS